MRRVKESAFQIRPVPLTRQAFTHEPPNSQVFSALDSKSGCQQGSAKFVRHVSMGRPLENKLKTQISRLKISASEILIRMKVR